MLAAKSASSSPRIAWPSGLPVYDHVVIVVEENKDYEQIAGNPSAPYINRTLRIEGADLLQMYGEEHHSEGNYFWLFSGSNQNVGFSDKVPPPSSITASNLCAGLIAAGRFFKGYSEDLPDIGSTVEKSGHYARKHVPWISFSNPGSGTTGGQAAGSSVNLRFEDFLHTPYGDLPAVSFVIPNLVNDMHDGKPEASIPAGDKWLMEHLDGYYQWAKQNNSLLILTFDENDHASLFGGLTDPAAAQSAARNRILTVFAGAHIRQGAYAEGKGVTHVNVLRTLESMYGLERSGGQQSFALRAGIADDFIITDVFDASR
ncbi:MAG TPA: alkaline phosphatase family protein [Thermoanaerobaculia bacterium]|nr:alkaline phosphatase family protein [Thermoanaerobaculia bacterium]